MASNAALNESKSWDQRKTAMSPSSVSLIRNVDASSTRPSAAISLPSSILQSRFRPSSQPRRSHSAASGSPFSFSSTPSPYALPECRSATAR